MLKWIKVAYNPDLTDLYFPVTYFQRNFEHIFMKPLITFSKYEPQLRGSHDFFQLKPCKNYHYTIWKKYENSIFEDVNTKFN